jgi:hypothetical protein
MVRYPSSRQRRDGVILVVVVSLLALFAVIGLGYVIYAESAATASRMRRETEVAYGFSAELQPEIVLNGTLARILYDSPDDATGVYNALRGHSLARSIYGWNPPSVTDPATGKLINTNVVPFNGTGHQKSPEPINVPGLLKPLSGLPWDNILNYTYFSGDPIIRDPERYPIDPNLATSYRQSLAGSPTIYFGGYNQPYTYPDLNNVFLAAVRASDGQVLTPSFHRPWLFLGPTPPIPDLTFLTNTTHPDWYKPSGRLKLLRPRPIDQVNLNNARQLQIWQANGSPPFPPTENITAGQLTQYSNATQALIQNGLIMPYPTDVGGDVKNLLGSPGGNDSVWIDLGLPVRMTRDGKKFKPLVAFLVRDLDGLVNINAAGNMRGQSQVAQIFPGQYTNLTHVSNMGVGRHEINVQKVLNPGSLQTVAAEYANLFTGNNTIGQAGRYTSVNVPQYPFTGNQLPSYLNPPTGSGVMTYNNVRATVLPATQFLDHDPPYYRIDLDASRESELRQRSIPPRGFAYQQAMLQPLTLSCFPDYYNPPPGNVIANTGATFGAAAIATTGYGNDSQAEQTSHPLLFNSMRKTGNSVLLDAQDMYRLQARYNSPLDWQNSTLSRILPNTLASAQVRHSITLLSADMSRPGLTPQTFTPHLSTVPTYGISAPMASPSVSVPPEMGPIPLAANGETVATANQLILLTPAEIAALPEDYRGNALSTFSAANGQVIKSPPPVSDGRNLATGLRERIDLNRPLAPYPAFNVAGPGRYFPNPADPQITLADRDRQAFAADIFNALCLAVGIKAPDSISLTVVAAVGDTRMMPIFLNPIAITDIPTYKYLAQLAANIVDDIDEDDVMTQFRWIDPAGTPPHPEVMATDSVVYGVEMPKVVLNEVYIEVTNGLQPAPVPAIPVPPMDYIVRKNPPQPDGPNNRKANKYRVNLWVELHNTMTPPYVNDNNPGSLTTQKFQQFRTDNAQWLWNGPTVNSAYQMHLISSTAAGIAVPDVNDPPPSLYPGLPAAQKKVTFSAANHVLNPVDTAITPAGSSPSSYRSTSATKNDGFFVVGPDQLSMPGAAVPIQHDFGDTAGATLQSPSMWFDVVAGALEGNFSFAKPKIVLQRLANPYIPAGPTNPYVTVDFMDVSQFTSAAGNPAHNVNISYWTGSPGNRPPALQNSQQPRSVVRRQPFAGHVSHLAAHQDPTMPPPAPSSPYHSFFRHNGNLDTPPTALPEPDPNGGLERFDWFVHHDRKLISPVELIHVADTNPRDVTQRFIYKTQISGPPPVQVVVRQGHTAPWTDDRQIVGNPPTSSLPLSKFVTITPAPAQPPTPSSRLYRALEMFRVGDRTIEMAFGGREIGKVNINTIYDQATFDAVCDAVRKELNGTPLFDSALNFTQADVNSVWTALTNGQFNKSARTPQLNQVGTYSQISGQDLPFWGMGAPHEALSQQYPPVLTNLPVGQQQTIQNAGIEATLLRSIVQNTTAPVFQRTRIFDAESQFNTTSATPPNATNPAPPVPHPMLEKSLLSKIFEHLTTRSNVFAVYMTVGYFEVKDDTQKPELLGDEIGVLRDLNGGIVESKAIRHRMFAIIDRTNLTLQPPTFNVTTGAMEQNDPQKREDPLRQGPAPYFYTSQLQLTPAVNPPTNSVVTRWKVVVPVTATATPNAGGYVAWASGQYNGISWQLSSALQPNASSPSSPPSPSAPQPLATQNASVLFVGTGSDQRRMVVCAIRTTGTTGFVEVEVGIPPAIPPGSPNDVRILNKWINLGGPPSSPALITNAIAGNPGPQPDFDHKQPNYRGVVLYSVIMD